MNITPRQKYNHDIIAKMDKFILSMPYDVWFKLGDDETKLAVVKDYIELKCLWPSYLTLSEYYKSFIKRKV
jgi:hypothetical protein